MRPPKDLASIFARLCAIYIIFGMIGAIFIGPYVILVLVVVTYVTLHLMAWCERARNDEVDEDDAADEEVWD